MTISAEQVEQWKEEAEPAMSSALWEYCPPQFFQLAEAYLALLASSKGDTN
jgi:hypothetical protein